MVSKGLPYSKHPLKEIPGDASLSNQKVAQELFKRTLIPIELEKVDVMCFLELRKQSVIIMHQVFS